MSLHPDDPNRGVLEALFEDTGSDPRFVVSLAQLYRDQVREFCSVAVTISDSEVGEMAHSLAGASLSLGLNHIAAALLDLEARIDKGEDYRHTLDGHIADLEAGSARIRQWAASFDAADAD